MKSRNIGDDLKQLMVQAEDEKTRQKVLKFDGPTIIYCPTKNATGEVAIALKSMNIKCDIYHAGLTLNYRKKSQTNFINDDIDVICQFFLVNSTLPLF